MIVWLKNRTVRQTRAVNVKSRNRAEGVKRIAKKEAAKGMTEMMPDLRGVKRFLNWQKHTDDRRRYI